MYMYIMRKKARSVHTVENHKFLCTWILSGFCLKAAFNQDVVLANASISPIAEPSTIPILVAPRTENSLFSPSSQCKTSSTES